MSKIKILVISNDNDGVGYYRINTPYLSLNDPDIDVKLLTLSDFSFRFTEETLKDFNIIIYHKSIPFRYQEDMITFSNIVNKYNIKIIYDIDDYWVLNSEHVNYNQWKKNNYIESTINQIKHSHFVTTTTPLFADEIKTINPNVIVFENAINTKEQQWTVNKNESDRIRFIWGGGVTHKPDLNLMKESFKIFNKEYRSKSQVYMCGYDLRLRTQDGLFKDSQYRNMWTFFEDVFINNGKNIDNPEYFKWLKTADDNGRLNYGQNDLFKDEFYQRRWTKPIFTYGNMYNDADVALAPLKSGNVFNKCKSQLKIIEAGIHKCPVIASNFGPYKIDVIDGKNGFLIDENNKQEWYNKMKWFIDNPNAVKDMGESLYELVMEKYTIDKINKKRIDFFKYIVNL